ncbi:hypothetical protein [Sorangium sp. So ce145]|uniref:hypothetical protein n=1 Tax=Sorangium sp. So ce145 TaxID=3133285 RepID=UPI003F60A116
MWIVHGDRWDPHNAVHRDALRQAVATGRPVELPVGSQLVYRVLNQLQPENRWIPELKPELPVVFPLLLYLDPRVTEHEMKRSLDDIEAGRWEADAPRTWVMITCNDGASWKSRPSSRPRACRAQLARFARFAGFPRLAPLSRVVRLCPT